MATGDNIRFTANLQKCSMGPGNTVLALKNFSGPPAGVSMGSCASVPPYTNRQK